MAAWFQAKDLGHDVADQSAPAVGLRQLRRSCPNVVETLADIGDHGFDLVAGGMGQQQAGLARHARSGGRRRRAAAGGW